MDKIIQISVSAMHDDTNIPYLLAVALTRNGNIWTIPLSESSDGKWRKVQPIESEEFKPEKKEVRLKYDADSDEMRLATLLRTLVEKRGRKLREPNMQTWAQSINHMITIDKLEPGHIESVIRWVQNDIREGKGFTGWANNILSTSKLREKWDVIVSQMPVGPEIAKDNTQHTIDLMKKELEDD